MGSRLSGQEKGVVRERFGTVLETQAQKAKVDAMRRQLRHAEEEAAQLRGERQRTLAARAGAERGACR